MEIKDSVAGAASKEVTEPRESDAIGVRGDNAESTSSIDLSVVVPTFRERDNIRPLLEKLSVALSGLSWEVIFVDDDSPDGTAELVNEIAREDARVRCL